MKKPVAGGRLCHHLIPWGKLALTLIWDPEQFPLARAILLPGPAQKKAARQTVAGDPPPVAAKIRAYLAGERPDFTLDDLELRLLAPFELAVTRATFRIPYGEVLSYGELARKARHPQAARAVGQVMANNRFPLVVPCHRVVRSDGHLGGFGGGLPMKRELLTLEGLTVGRDYFIRR